MKPRVYALDQATSDSSNIRWWLRMIFILLLLTSLSSVAPGQAKEWDKTFGGGADDNLTSLEQTSDGGYILGGRSASPAGGDKTEANRGVCEEIGEDFIFCRGDYWVVKLDATGQKEWDKTFGGTGDELLGSLEQTSDGGYILGGYSESPAGGDKTEASKGGDDYWVVKLSADGVKEWDKTIGGNGQDQLTSLQQTSDGGYVLGGLSNSDISGDKTEASGGGDYWVVKLSADGVKEWDKTIGGNGQDQLTSLQQTSDGGYVLGGYSNSDISRDKTEANRGFGGDYWVVKLDAAGQKEWDRTFGGSDFERLESLEQTSDGGYVLGGYSFSDISGDKTEANRGTCEPFYGCPADYWVVKLDATGQKEWDRTLGGSDNEVLQSLKQTSDGGYVLGGYSNSDISRDKTEANRGFGGDYWVVKLDAAGQKEWDRTFGGRGIDMLSSLEQTSDGGYVLGGASASPAGGDKTEASRGGYDYWVVKLGDSLCPAVSEVAITGSTTAMVNSTGSAYTLSASGAASFAWSITDPDGAPYNDFTGQGTGTIAVDWPAEPSAYKVSVTYGGGAGCPSRTAVTYVHVFDPQAGFVSGGGWSDSPQHADYELMQEGGKAYWGFVARYKKGDADRVQGSALVVLESGPAAFRSTGVEDGSLVISGNRAFFRGTGTLARHENSGIVTDPRRFGFLVAAIDGQLEEGNDPDRLRLKVWVIQNDGTEGEVVYDGQVACPSANLDNNAEACQAIDKGSIVIHRSGLSAWRSLAAEETPQEEGLVAYPTAFSDRTTLAFAAAGDTDFTLELYDLRGALVRRIAAGAAEAGRRYEHEVRAEGMANGVYLARLTTADKVQTVKLILER